LDDKQDKFEVLQNSPWSQGGPGTPRIDLPPDAKRKRDGANLLAAVKAIHNGKTPRPIFDMLNVDSHVLDAEILEHFWKTGELMEVSRQLADGQHVAFAPDPTWEPTCYLIMECVDQAIAHLWSPLSKNDGVHQWDAKRSKLQEAASAAYLGHVARMAELRDLAPHLPADIVAERESQNLALRKMMARKLARDAALLIFKLIQLAAPSAAPLSRRHRANHAGDEAMIIEAISSVDAGKTMAKAVAAATEQFRGGEKEAGALRKRIERKVRARLGQSAANS
jgi:hypothetical protein